MITGQTTYVRTAETCEIIYNDKKQVFKMKDIDQGDGTVNILLEDIPEGKYYFDITTYDKYHNKSLLTRVFGTVYGENEKQMLRSKKITDILPQPNGSVKLQWNGANPTFVELKYEKKNGQFETIPIEGTTSVTILRDWKLGGGLYVNQTYKKKKDDIDVFKMDELTYTFPEKILHQVPVFSLGSKMVMGSSREFRLNMAYSIEFMVKYDELKPGPQSLITNWLWNNCFFYIYSDGNTLNVDYINSWGWNHVVWSGRLEVDRWYHMVFTARDGRYALYIDGKEAVVKNNCGPIQGRGGDLIVGFPDGSRNFYGSVQHISVWDHILSNEKIAKHAELKGVLSGEEKHLEAYWPMTNNFGYSVQDVTGKHTATFIKVVWQDVE